MSRVAAALRFPFRLVPRTLDRVTAAVDDSPAADDPAAVRLRRGLAVLIFAFGGVLVVRTLLGGALPPLTQLLILMLAVAVYTNRGGRFLRDWVPVFLGAVAYLLADQAVQNFGFAVHYTPQIDAERALAFGSLPTIWLQSHLYDGATGVLEIVATVVYVSHFLAPIFLAFLIWAVWDRRGFTDLLFGILAVTVLGEITFVLAPTAPPWLAADQGLIAPVHHVIREALFDIGLTSIAAQKDVASAYNVVAAIPSLHAAWPVIGLLVIRKYRLPRWLFGLQAAFLGAVVFSIVYTGEHYVVDAIVGVAYALVAWWLLQLALAPGRKRATTDARPAGALVPPAAAADEKA